MATFEGNIISSVQRGDVFVIAGKFRPNPKKALIAFKNGTYAEADTVFAIDVDFTDSDVVVNFTSHKYKRECRNPEKISKALFTDFNFYLMTSDYKVDICLNDEVKLMYECELELSSIKGICVDGDIEEVNRFDHRRNFPQSCPTVQEETKAYNFSADLPRCFEAGDTILIEAIPRENFVLTLMEDGCDQRHVLDIIGTFDDDGLGSIELKKDDSSTKLSPSNFFKKKFQMEVSFEKNSSVISFFDPETPSLDKSKFASSSSLSSAKTITRFPQLGAKIVSSEFKQLNNSSSIKVKKTENSSLEITSLYFKTIKKL